MLKYVKEVPGIMKRYNTLKAKVIERNDEFKALCDYIEKETEWLISPASTRHHLAKDCGLLEHSCNVAETMLNLKDALAQEISDESCVIVALLHDLGKVGMPGKPQYIANEATPRQKMFGHDARSLFKFNTDLTYLSIPIRSLYLALPYLPLSEEEVQAIAYHDGQYVDDNHSVARILLPKVRDTKGLHRFHLRRMF